MWPAALPPCLGQASGACHSALGTGEGCRGYWMDIGESGSTGAQGYHTLIFPLPQAQYFSPWEEI